MVHFLELIPYMYVHLPTMLECKKCQQFLSQCNMSCSLLSTVMSNKWQYLHVCWLCISQWHFFWNIPIINILFCSLIFYDNRVSFRMSGSRLPNWLTCNLQFDDLSLNIVQNNTLHVDMSGKMGHSTEIWLLTVADSEHTNFISGMIGT